MNENHANEENAISVYGQEGLEDFPVLKAFQQYIDAEQNKARKRMIVLCVFFGFLMTVVIAVFLVALMNVTEKNQQLNDRLVEYAMKSGERQNVIVQSPSPAAPQNDTAIKAVADSLAAMQKQLAEQQAKDQERLRAEAERLRAEAAKRNTPPPPTKEEIERKNKIEADTKKLARATALLKAEKQKLAAEKEKLRQQEIELHRRRMYPEYYEKQDKLQAKSAPKAEKPKATAPVNYFDAYRDDEDAEFNTPEDDDIDALIDTLPASSAGKTVQKKPVAKKSVAKKQTAKKPVVAKAEPVPEPEPVAKPVPTPKPEPAPMPLDTKRPAQNADHFNVPLEINGEAGDWLIPTT